jgi:hypothetical protein
MMSPQRRIAISDKQVILLLSILVLGLSVMVVSLWLRIEKLGEVTETEITPLPTYTLQLPTTTASPGSPTTTPTNLPTITPLPACEWQPFSDVFAVSQTNQPDCFSGLLELGFGEENGRLLFFKTLQRQRGLYGLVKMVENSDDILVRVDVKKLVAGRFLVALSPSQTPNDSSIGFRIQSEDGKAFFVKVVYFMPGGYEKELSASPSNPNWGSTYNINFKVSGSKVKVIVNQATLVQWDINFENRYLFVGYQAIPTEKASTSLDVSVEFP